MPFWGMSCLHYVSQVKLIHLTNSHVCIAHAAEHSAESLHCLRLQVRYSWLA